MKIFPSKHEKLITAVIFSFLIGLCIGLITKVQAKELFVGLITLFAAFAGAYSAFALQNKKQQLELETARVEAGNKAIFNLINCCNTFLNFKNQFIEPFINEPGRFLAIPPSVEFKGKANFDFDSLTYLFELEDPNIVGELSSFQAKVESTILLILQRSQMHINTVQPTLEKAGFVEGQDITNQKIEQILGQRLIAMMQQRTDQMVEGVESIITESENLIDKLHSLYVKNYKGYKVLKMQKLNKANSHGKI
jgi:hypothetical protein